MPAPIKEAGEILTTIPIVSSSTADSLTTRPTDKTMEVTMPGIALGKTTLKMVLTLLAPKAKEASRRELGTSLSASSTFLTIVGRIMMERVSPPPRSEYPQPKLMTKTKYPNKP